jgi:hypothetical protein
MEEHYKSTTILITAEPAVPQLKWKPICQIMFMQGGEK